MGRVFTLFLVLVCIVAASLAYFYWPNIEHRMHKMAIDKTQENKDIATTKELLNNGKPEEAWQIIQKYSDDIDNRTEEGKEWIDLLIRASEATLNTTQLSVLYEYYPKAFDSHEKASLLVAGFYLGSGRTKDYQTIRDSWKGRETLPETWFILDGDKLLAEGKRKEAVDFLKSRSFSGKADTPRLERLALIYIFEDPKTSWDYLNQAHNKDPENPEILSYRAKFLETYGKPTLALTEYLAALQTDPKNLYLRDQLAEFYLRQRQYQNALQIWSENLKSPSVDFIWLKTLFWNSVVTPIQFDWAANKPPQGKLEPLIAYLQSLKPGEFWNESTFANVPNGAQYLKTQQVTFWLRLLSLLKQGKEKEALDLLQFNPFQTVSWNPALETALKRILLYRTTGQLNRDDVSANEKASTTPSANLLPFFAQLETLANTPTSTIPEDLKELLKGPEAFAAAFLATGWFEAALDLHTTNVIPATYPDWYAYDLTQAIRVNKGVPAALEFATLQTPSKPLSLLIGELLISSNSPDAGLDRLAPLAKEDNDIGKRAAQLISLVQIERGQYADAKQTIESNPKLSQDVVGQETLARVALLEGNTEMADKLYSALEDKSAEAKSYLARKAFAEKDWKRARLLTEQLLLVYPTNPMLQENLKKIMDEQNKAK